MSDPTRKLIDLIKINDKHLKASHINKLLAEGADINGIDGEFPLFDGVVNNNYTVVKYLIERGANVSQSNSDGITPLHLACAWSYTRIGELLIKKDANIMAKTIDGNTPLMLATSRDNVKLAEMLLDADAVTASAAPSSASASASAAPSTTYSTLEEYNNLGETPLNIACENENRELIELFVSNGANVTHAMNNGDKPIHQLCQKKRRDLIAYLIDEGANVDEQNDLTGETSLLIATKNCDEITTSILLKYGANPSIPNNLGFLPIHNVAATGCMPSLWSLMEAIRNTPDISKYINARKGDGLTPLYIACLEENERMVRELINYGADPNIGDINGTRPLDVLFETTGNRKLYKLLLDAKADPNYMSSEDGHAPIVYAIWRGDPEIVKMLIDAKANVNRVDIDGNTPLMIACGVHGNHEPNIEIIKTLLDANVDVNIRSAGGETALEILNRLHPDVAKDLRRYKTAMVSYFLDPTHPRPMMSQIDAESIENIRDYMGGKRKSRRHKASKHRQTSKRSHK